MAHPPVLWGSVTDPTWWQRAVIYQIYPRSWMDSDGDGIGDLPGVIARLDHLRWLGVDAIWLSPVYPSPMVDFGYDVADYCDIDPLFGTLADFDRLVAQAHARGIRVLLDWVPNHTSDQHPWFVASRSSRDDPKRDWYIWRDPRPDGGPPSSWLNYSGNSTWKWDEDTQQYYYRVFTDSQPDLNWRNPDVREAMYETLRFWLRRGVDGFRIDVLSLLVEDDELRDNPPNPDYRPGVDFPYAQELSIYHVDRPETRELVRHIRKVVDEFGDDKVLLAELVLPLDQTVAYYGENGEGIQVPFNFELITADWDARGLVDYINHYLAALPAEGWPNWVLGNHDVSRVATRLGSAQARVAAMLMMTLPGTPTLYYGDEIGQRDVEISPEQVLDPIAALIPGRGRDPERGPMQWSAGPGAGFSTAEPWLPLAADYESVNVEAQQDDPRSMLTLHRRLIELRRQLPALVTKSYEPVAASGDLLAYVRSSDDERCLVVLNLGDQPGQLTSQPLAGRIVLSTYLDREGDVVGGELTLRGNEGVVVLLGS